MARASATRASPGRKTGCGLKRAGHCLSPSVSPRITRSKDRVRIETAHLHGLRCPCFASPGRKTGCGLKPGLRRRGRRDAEASPGRKTGCGLKHARGVRAQGPGDASPGRKTGCGLKPAAVHGDGRPRDGITRSKDRVRIETARLRRSGRMPTASPGRKTGCGLKPRSHAHRAGVPRASPGRKTGCGLKPSILLRLLAGGRITRSKDRVRIETE